jgi:hypothetical protein
MPANFGHALQASPVVISPANPGRYIGAVEGNEVLWNKGRSDLLYRSAAETQTGPDGVVPKAVFADFVLGVCGGLQDVVAIGQAVYDNELTGKA